MESEYEQWLNYTTEIKVTQLGVGTGRWVVFTMGNETVKPTDTPYSEQKQKEASGNCVLGYSEPGRAAWIPTMTRTEEAGREITLRQPRVSFLLIDPLHHHVCVHTPFEPLRFRFLRAYGFGLAGTSKYSC